MSGGRARSRTTLVAVFAAIVLAVAAVILFALRPHPATVHTAAAARGDLLVRVLCDGDLEPPPGGELRTAEGGTAGTVAIRDGDRVTRGEVLLRLDNREIAGGERQALGDLSRLAAERAAAAADLARARREAAYRRRQADADRRLVAARALPAATADADELAAREAESQASAAAAQLGSITGSATPGAPREPSRQGLAEAAAADLSRRAAALAVRAPFDGVVYGLPRAGQLLQPGERVAEVTDPAHPRVRFRIDPPDVPRIAVGQRLIVSSNGLAGRSWEGRVTAAAGALREVGGRQVGEATGEIADPGGALSLNAAVDVQVVVAERRGVLTVPRGALRRQGDRRFVWRVDGGEARRRDVTVGLVGLDQVEVESGLAAGDLVVTDAAVALSEGERVRTAAP